MLLPLPDSTVVQKTLEQLLAAGVDEIVVVTGRDGDLVESEINPDALGQKLKIIHNPDYHKGQTTSIQVGLRAIDDADAVMICLGDMPLLKAEDYCFLMHSFANQNEYSIQVPFFKGQKGNPVIFAQKHFQEILNHTEMNGCSAVVQRNSESVCRIEVSSDHFIQDIDTPEDYQQILKAFE